MRPKLICFLSAKAIEYMIVDALLSAEPHLKIAERVKNPKKFLYLSDIIMNTIEESDDPVSHSLLLVAISL